MMPLVTWTYCCCTVHNVMLLYNMLAESAIAFVMTQVLSSSACPRLDVL